MNYLGGVRGTGLLLCGEVEIAPADYDFDGYLSKAGQVTVGGEIRLPVAVLKGVFGREDLQLRTVEGRLLRLHFTEKRHASDDGAAHVDVVGDLPGAAEWLRQA
ncbi:MAG: hypothetical protein ACAH27_06145 [Xanthobacteraceae bacterium]